MPLPLCTPHQVSVVKPLLRLFKVALLFVFVHYRTQSLPYNGELSVICTSGTSDQIQEKEKRMANGFVLMAYTHGSVSA